METQIYKSHRAALSPEELKQLSCIKQWKPLCHTIWLWTGVVAAWSMVAIYPAWWTILIAIPIIGTRYYALFILGHDGMHRRLFYNTQMNDLFCDLFLIGPVGAITRINKKNHLEHHNHLSTEDDPDRHKHTCFGKSTTAEYLLFLTGIKSLKKVVTNSYVGKKNKLSNAKIKNLVLKYTLRDLLILCSIQLAIIFGLTVSIGWWAYLVLWLLPIFIFAYLADLARSFLEHAQPEPDEKADEHRLITYKSNPIEKLFLAPLNMNFHAAHHLWTSIPYYNLPQADKILQRHQTPGLIWRKSYFLFALQYLKSLPIFDCKK